MKPSHLKTGMLSLFAIGGLAYTSGTSTGFLTGDRPEILAGFEAGDSPSGSFSSMDIVRLNAPAVVVAAVLPPAAGMARSAAIPRQTSLLPGPAGFTPVAGLFAALVIGFALTIRAARKLSI